MRFMFSKRGAAVVILILAVAFLVRPGVGRLRVRIVKSISAALGRPVEASAVNLRLLPQPGFDLKNFVVHDDPAFSAEPMLRADEVTASLRLFSLLRGRLEIARLDFSGPSINLVRNQAGQWNLQNLLQRADQIAVAPTSKTRRERRPGFPYIEADGARINLKLGEEKTPYALTNAEFAIWQDSENTWAMRLKAQPLRTDFNLSDMGSIRMNASWQRAASLRETPLQLSLQWEHAQLGQLTKLIAGTDKGWRGTVAYSANLKGTPGDLQVDSSVSVDDFRRYDIGDGGDLRLAAQCRARYDSASRLASDIDCEAPVGNGTLRLAGNIDNLFGLRSYDLILTASSVPAQSLASLARHVKKDIPADVTATGGLDASLEIQRAKASAPAEWEGSGEIADLHLTSQVANTALAVDRVPLLVSSSHGDVKAKRKQSDPASDPRVEVGPFNLALSKGISTQIQGWFSRSGYDFHLAGDTQLHGLFEAARAAGIATPKVNADGVAKVNLQIAGGWMNFGAPRAVGKAQLHSVSATIRGLNEPLEIASAKLTLTSDQVLVQNLSASAAGTNWHGSLSLPRPCIAPACEVRFDLRADEISTDRLNRLMNPSFSRQPWYSFLGATNGAKSYLKIAHASGKFAANRLLVRQLIVNHVSADATLDGGVLKLSNLQADVLGGKEVGDWTADFSHKPPQYSGSGKLDRVALADLSKLMNDGWITGSASGKYHVSLAGLSSPDLVSSATGILEVQIHDGLLPHILVRERPGPLQINNLDLHLHLREGQFEIEKGKLETPAAVYQVSGSSRWRNLNVKFSRDGYQDVSITGDVSQPHVSSATLPDTSASLKASP